MAVLVANPIGMVSQPFEVPLAGLHAERVKIVNGTNRQESPPSQSAPQTLFSGIDDRSDCSKHPFHLSPVTSVNPSIVSTKFYLAATASLLLYTS